MLAVLLLCQASARLQEQRQDSNPPARFSYFSRSLLFAQSRTSLKLLLLMLDGGAGLPAAPANRPAPALLLLLLWSAAVLLFQASALKNSWPPSFQRSNV
jgi:hypothetical protein